MDYPDTLPIPDATPYDWEVGMGVNALKMNAGNLILRRRFNHLPHRFAFVFSMDSNDMVVFSNFADQVGSTWFNIRALAMWTSLDFLDKIPVRFISNITVNANGFNWWTISVDAELSPDVFWSTLTGDWVDGGFVYAPSPEWIDAGNPQAPSPTWIDAGLATRPSSPLSETIGG